MLPIFIAFRCLLQLLLPDVVSVSREKAWPKTFVKGKMKEVLKQGQAFYASSFHFAVHQQSN